MRSIETINAQYVQVCSSLQIFKNYSDIATKAVSDFSIDDNDRFLKVMDAFKHMNAEADCQQYQLFSDVFSIAVSYESCLKAISAYKYELQKLSKKDSHSDRSLVIAAANAVKTTQYNFEVASDCFQKEHEITIENTEKLNQILIRCLNATMSSLEQTADDLKSEAHIAVESQYDITLSSKKNLSMSEKLPAELLVGRYRVKSASNPVLRDIGITSNFSAITNNLHSQGNILLKTTYDQMSDSKIDAFVVAYIFRCLEAFPLGALNVHIIDNNASFLYKRLCDSFQSGSVGENAGKAVQLYSSTDILKNFQDVICTDIFRKTSASCPDLYSIYNTDQTDAFHLIIIRDGLLNGNGYAPTEVLNAINALSKINEMGHRCGIRFLIIDDNDPLDKNLSEKVKSTLDSIQKNCALQFQYSNGKFYYQDTPVEMLYIADEIESFVEKQSQHIAKLLSVKERSCVSLSEVEEYQVSSGNESIMYIPVGKSGAEIVQLPLSCKDDNGTVAGQCIGYIAIGQSGSGKSSFFHSVILNGCMKYSPKDLQFWLLDFKFGGASSKYSRSGIPHIRLIAENNHIDDALCLFQMISEEMDRRNKAFNQNFVDNIVDYNKIADENDNLEYFPRIIIAIDEIQEIFREDNASILQKLISSISVRMRSAGMHFIMVAQNLSEGKSYMLKDAFMPSASGRICFRVSENIPRDSGFPEEFWQRKQEITELKTGEAYVSYGKGTIKKVKMAYASPEDMVGTYFSKIRGRYPQYTDRKPLVIGSKQRLTIAQSIQKGTATYYEAISELRPVNGVYGAIIGEDAYRMEPQYILFTQNENSAVLLLGDDKEISSSLCTSITCSLARQGAHIHLFNGDKSKIQDGYNTIPHPFMYIGQGIGTAYRNIVVHKLNELEAVVKCLYTEYLQRQNKVQESEDDIPDFSAEFLVINDLFGIESFVRNNLIADSRSYNASERSTADRYDLLDERLAAGNIANGMQFRENIQNILSILLKTGYRYNIHVVLAIKGDPSVWRNSRMVSDVNNIIVFNTTQYTDQIDNAYYLKEMLRNISNDQSEETMCVWAGKHKFSKVRPIIYKLVNPAEKRLLDALIREV